MRPIYPDYEYHKREEARWPNDSVHGEPNYSEHTFRTFVRIQRDGVYYLVPVITCVANNAEMGMKMFVRDVYMTQQLFIVDHNLRDVRGRPFIEKDKNQESEKERLKRIIQYETKSTKEA